MKERMNIRTAAPEALKRQFAYCQQVARALGLPVLSDGGAP